MSQIEVDKVIPQSGTSLQLGENGDTISVPAGATFNASAGTFTLPDGSVVEAKIANSAVTNDKLAGSIANSKLANSAITINGSAVSLGGSVTIETGTSWQSSIKTATFTAAAGEGYFINTSGGAFEADLPGSPSVGDVIEFVDFSRSFGTHALTLDQGSLKFQGNTSPKPVYSTDGQSIRIVYSGTTQGWIPTSDDTVTNETPQTYSADFLVIAGGGGGGYDRGGGGGAGGYRNSYSSESSGGGGSSESSLTLNAGTVYTITVGDGGTGGTSGSRKGSNGSDSSISGSDITDITSTGGGGGGSGLSGTRTPNSGGSGGGAGYSDGSSLSGGSGTANQGHDGGSYANGVNAGGGGGAGQAGSNPTGGNGLASSITGSSVTRAGGGGGHNGSSSAPAGGSGGGGTGGRDGVSIGQDGTVNTGSGGGSGAGGGSSLDGGDGGKGVVILRVPAAKYSGTTTGSPTVSDSGSDKVLIFNSSGSYTG